MPLRVCMEAHTDLERDVILYWIAENWYEKSLTDHYLQRVAFEIRCANPAYARKKVKLDDVEVKFPKRTIKVRRGRKKATPKIDVQTASKWAQARWFAAVGYKGK